MSGFFIITFKPLIATFSAETFARKPALGVTWNHVASVRLELWHYDEVVTSHRRNGSGDEQEDRVTVAFLERSPRVSGANKSMIKVTGRGVVDVVAL